MTIQGFLELTYHISSGVSFSAFWHFDVDQLIDEAIEKSRLYIHLVNIEVIVCCYCKVNTKGHRFYYCGKRLIEIHPVLLQVAFHYQSGFELSDVSIYISLYFVYPFPS